MIGTKITCTDKYEAQKLASLIFVKKGNETYITEILNVFDNEVVILIKDKSLRWLAAFIHIIGKLITRLLNQS